MLNPESDYPNPFDMRASGTGAPANSVADPANEIEAAVLMSTRSLPMAIGIGDTPITIEVNGGNQVVNPHLSTRGRVTGAITEPYNIILNSNDTVRFYVDRYTVQEFAVDAGAGLPAEDIGEDIEVGTTPPGIVNCTSIAEPDTVVWIESLLYGDGSRIIVDTSATDTINATIGLWQDQEGRGSDSYPMSVVKGLNEELTNARAYTVREMKSFGKCTVDTGATNKFDLPAGEGLNVSEDDILLIKEGPNPGAYKIITIATDKITVHRSVWDNTDTVAREYEVVFEPLTIESAKIDALDSSLYSAGTIFGFPTTKVWGKVSDFEDSSGFPFVRTGDVLNVGGSDYEVSWVSGVRLILSTLLGMDLGSSSYNVYSADEQSYSSLVTALGTWKTAFNAAYPNFNNLTSYTNRVLANPSLANRTQLKGEITNILTQFSGTGSLSDKLDDLTVRELPAGERLLKLLEERRSLRGRDLLKSLDFTSFFDFDAPLSYEQNVLEKLAVLLRKYSPAEAIGDEIDDEILEDSSTPGVEFETEDPELIEPEDEYIV